MSLRLGHYTLFLAWAFFLVFCKEGFSQSGPDMAAHRAVYDLSLLKSSNGGPESARGRIVVEFSGSA